MIVAMNVNKSAKAVDVNERYYDGVDEITFRHDLSWFPKRNQKFIKLGSFKDNDLVYIAYYHTGKWQKDIHGYFFQTEIERDLFLKDHPKDYKTVKMYFDTLKSIKVLTSRAKH